MIDRKPWSPVFGITVLLPRNLETTPAQAGSFKGLSLVPRREAQIQFGGPGFSSCEVFPGLRRARGAG